MARIAPGGRREIGLINQLIAQVAGKVTGSQPLNIFTTIGRHRWLFRRWLVFASGLMPGGKLSRRDTELVILRVAHITSCEYEAAHHRAIGRRAGLSEAEIDRVAAGPEDEGWSEGDRILLRAVDELLGDGEIGDETWSGLRGFLDDAQLIELCMLVGHYVMVAMTLKTLRVPLEAG